MLEIRDVSKQYRHRFALENVSCEIQDSTTTLLLGPNGAGKTTLVKCIMGLVKYSGRISLYGLDARNDTKIVHSLVGYMPQQSAFQENLTVAQHTDFTGGLKGASSGEIREAIERSGLWESRSKRISFLSSGMRQRLGIALALLRDPPYVIFDEPTNNIDIRSQIEFQSTLRRLRESKKTILIATHISGFGEFADNAIILDFGKVVATGPPKELLQRLGEQDTVFLRVRNEFKETAFRTIVGLGLTPATQEGEWIRLRLPDAMKANLIQSLLQAGCVIDDVAVESTELESDYIRLVGAPT